MWNRLRSGKGEIRCAQGESREEVFGRCHPGSQSGVRVWGALLSALYGPALSWLIGVDVPFIFCVLSAVICGYAVKFGSLDTPGALFSSIAVVGCVIGSILGKVGMLAVTHLTMYTLTSAFTSVLGLLLAIYVAWKIGGGDT